MKKLLLIALSSLLILGAACTGSSSEPTTKPVIVAFTVNPSSINAGATATLMWNVTGADAISIFPGIGQVETAGVMQVTPTVSTVYTLNAVNAAGITSQTAAVTVATMTVPVINSFTANPATVISGQSTTLQWNVSGANSVSIDQGIGKVDPSATTSVKPSVTTTYTLSATNAGGNVTKSVTVSMNTATAPSVVSFTADPASITPGQTSTLQWDVSGATNVSITPGIGTVSASGTRAVHPMITTNYTLTATNAAGSITAPTTVTVSNAANDPPTIKSFTSSSSNITTGGTATLTWNVSNATTVSIDQNIGAVAATGTQSVTPTATITYTLTATNPNGTKTATVTINVGTMTGTPPTIISFTANPTTIYQGSSSILTWNISGKITTISIDPDVGTPRAFQITQEVFPNATTTYTLTATNEFGSTTATAKVTVQ